MTFDEWFRQQPKFMPRAQTKEAWNAAIDSALEVIGETKEHEDAVRRLKEEP